MAEIKNTFIKSKMNKDLDDRIVPPGEYRDALNIQISRSEGDDVGALETVLGNELFFGEETYNTCIGTYADVQNQVVYYFVTDYIDASADGLSNRAPDDAYCAIIKYDAVTFFKTVLVKGSFLNFSARSQITGINIIEDLLFWTDNRNQPRKINVRRAAELPAEQPESGRSSTSLIPTPYYTSEDQISVAKYYPNSPILLLNLYDTVAGNVADDSTMTNPTEQYYPGGTSPKPDYDSTWPGDPEYLSDKFIRLSYRFKFDDNEYSLMAPFTQPCFIPKQFGYFLTGDNLKTYESTIVDFFENNVTQIIANISFESLRPDLDLHIKEVDILYKESDALQVKVVETIPINTIVNRIQENYTRTSGNGYVYDYKYISTKPYKSLPEDQITRVYDQVPTRALAQEVSGNRVIYGNFTTTQSQPKTLDYSVSFQNKLSLANGGTNQIEYPNHTLKQNRNYQLGVILADRYGRQSSVILSSRDTNVTSGGASYGGSTIYVPYKPNSGTTPMNWPGYALQMLINEPIPNLDQTDVQNYPGLYKDYSKGVDRVTVTTPGSTYSTGTNIATTGGTGSGLTVDIISTSGLGTVSEAFVNNPGTGYVTGDVVTITGGSGTAELTVTVLPANPLGWYSYKIVVRQTEQDYYNCYLPGILNGFPDSYVETATFGVNRFANIVLINDNINKIPRDLEEVGPDQKQYRSAVRLFGRVAPLNQTGPAYNNYNQQYYPSTIADSVTSISTLEDVNYNGTTLGNIQTSGTSSYTLDYEEFFQYTTNPLIAKLSTTDPIGKQNITNTGAPSYSYTLAVYETDPVESLLDIYWETTSTGIISELNSLIQEGGYEGAVDFNGFQFILAEDSLPGTDCFQGPIQVLNGFGAIIDNDVEYELVSVTNKLGINVSEKFVLVPSGAGGPADPKSFNIRTTAISSGDTSDSFFYYGPVVPLNTFIFTIKCTYTNPSTTEVTVSNLVINDQELINRFPEIYTLSGFPVPPLDCSSTPITTCNPIPIASSSIQAPVVTDTVIYTFGVSNGSLCNGDNFSDNLTVEFPGMDTSVFEAGLINPNDPGRYQIKVKAGAPSDINPKDVVIKVTDAGGLIRYCGTPPDLPKITYTVIPELNINYALDPNGGPICDVGAEDGSGAWNNNTKVGRLRYSILWQGLDNGQTYDVEFVMGPNTGIWPTQAVQINGVAPGATETVVATTSTCPDPITTFTGDATGLKRQYFDVWWEGITARLNFTIKMSVGGTVIKTVSENWGTNLTILGVTSCVGGQCSP
jgi:hypothetical protein